MKDPYFSHRSSVVDISQALLQEGLVVRTWGNVSRRTEGTAFVITPSGRTYGSMIESDLACVDKEGETHGPFKASSEHPMHQVCYEQRPQAQMVVHTHQRYASALSQLGRDLELTEDEAAKIGQRRIRISPYGLPSTKKLHSAVEATLKANPGDNVVLLEAHGVFLCGDTPEHALQLARDVEAAAERIYREVTGSDLLKPEVAANAVARSQRDTCTGLVTYYNQEDQEIQPSREESELHKWIYSKRKDAGALRVCVDSEVAALQQRIEGGKPLRPYLDDFAQIVGVKADGSARHNVVFSNGRAVCVGADEDDANAVESVLKKNARAARIAQVAGREPIVGWECRLMNVIYRLKYSKQAG